MPERVGNFSAGAASAIACRIGDVDRIVYAETGAEDADNERFVRECEQKLFSVPVERVRSKKFRDTWDVWERKRFLAGVHGAPCTRALKRIPLNASSTPGDVIIIGYTAEEWRRAEALTDHAGDGYAFPLIERGLTKEACRAMLSEWGVREPRVYALGFDHANCIPCSKATSGSYWQLIRKHYPEAFARYAALERSFGKDRGQVWWKGRYIHLDELPVEDPRGRIETPACDILCQIALETA